MSKVPLYSLLLQSQGSPQSFLLFRKQRAPPPTQGPSHSGPALSAVFVPSSSLSFCLSLPVSLSDFLSLSLLALPSISLPHTSNGAGMVDAQELYSLSLSLTLSLLLSRSRTVCLTHSRTHLPPPQPPTAWDRLASGRPGPPRKK